MGERKGKWPPTKTPPFYMTKCDLTIPQASGGRRTQPWVLGGKRGRIDGERPSSSRCKATPPAGRVRVIGWSPSSIYRNRTRININPCGKAEGGGDGAFTISEKKLGYRGSGEKYHTPPLHCAFLNDLPQQRKTTRGTEPSKTLSI